ARDVEGVHRAVAFGEVLHHLLGAVLRRVFLGHAEAVALGEPAGEDLLHLLLRPFGQPGRFEFEQLERGAILSRKRLDHPFGGGRVLRRGDFAVGIGLRVAPASGAQDRSGERQRVNQAHSKSPFVETAVAALPARYQPRAPVPTIAVRAAVFHIRTHGRTRYSQRLGGTRYLRSVRSAQAATPREIDGRPPVRARLRLPARGRPAGGDPRAGGCGAGRREDPGPARRDRLGQDLHDGQGDRGAAAPRPRARPEQDPRRPALWRVRQLLPQQRGRVFRLLL